MCLDRVDPSVANAVAELLLLPPEDALRQVCTGPRHVESLSEHPLFHPLLPGLVGTHLLPRVEVQREFHEAPVKEGDARLDAPGHHGLVRAEAVVEVQLFHLADVLLVELCRVRCFVEVKVAAKDLIGTLPAEHHLDARCLDSPRHEVHGCGSAHGCHVEALEVVDDIGQGIDALLRRESELVVHGAQVLGHFAGRLQVRARLQADAEGMQLGPISRLAAISLDAPVAVSGHNRSHQR
mmetsp:Transcript_118441/g.330400  ORF Transcript_118441/g.330400 Transcript_118441/m.330400 type:complete len:238 (-) Transcript_118441:799-1512(-)